MRLGHAGGQHGRLARLALCAVLAAAALPCGAPLDLLGSDPPSVVPPTSGNAIGDGRASDSSSKEFFLALDENMDGKVGKTEIRNVIVAFGGRSLDEPEEIDASLNSLMSRIDINNDRALSPADINTHLHRMGAVLTVDAVADWIVHGLQLPVPVGEQFRANSVTGYDFPELVEDEGQALLEDVEIARPAYRKKILRAMRMMMTGVGVAPDAPFPLEPTEVTCDVVTLTWGKSDGAGFAVHKYRVFRRLLTPRSRTSGSSLGEAPVDPNLASSGVYANSEWTVIYDGPEREARDYDARAGLHYEYRVEAWNLFGHSEATVTAVVLPTLTTCGLGRGGLVRELLLLLSAAWEYFASLVRWLWPVFGIVTALMRIRRTSSAHRRDRIDFWMDKLTWKLLAVLAHWIPYGRRIIPRSMRSDPGVDVLRVDESGKASPVALGTSGVSHVVPPEVASARSEQSRDVNHKNCRVCRKEFKPFKRVRHTCCVCDLSFCASHGQTTHPWYVSCPVGGKCVCDECRDTQSVELRQSPPLAPNLRQRSTGKSKRVNARDEYEKVQRVFDEVDSTPHGGLGGVIVSDHGPALLAAGAGGGGLERPSPPTRTASMNRWAVSSYSGRRGDLRRSESASTLPARTMLRRSGSGFSSAPPEIKTNASDGVAPRRALVRSSSDALLSLSSTDFVEEAPARHS